MPITTKAMQQTMIFYSVYLPYPYAFTFHSSNCFPFLFPLPDCFTFLHLVSMKPYFFYFLNLPQDQHPCYFSVNLIVLEMPEPSTEVFNQMRWPGWGLLFISVQLKLYVNCNNHLLSCHGDKCYAIFGLFCKKACIV